MHSTASEIEVEVAYLATALPVELRTANPVPFVDIYLSGDQDLLTKLRLRQKGDKYEITKKVVLDASDLSTQAEYNIPLSAAEFSQFSSMGGRVVTKDRYYVELGGRLAEVDVFKGALRGFVLIEYEFSSTVERDAFTPPPICGADVTQEDFIAGAFLAGKSYSDIEAELARFAYVPLYP